MSVTTTQLTTADSAGFVPQLWCKKALDVLRNNIVLAKMIRKDVDYTGQDFQSEGKTLNIPYPGTFTAQDKAANAVANVQAPVGGATVALTLSKYKTVDFIVEDYAAAQANDNLLTRWVQPAVIAMVEKLEADLITMYTSLTGIPSGVQGGHSGYMTYADIASMRKNFNDLKIPQSERFIMVSDKDEIGILQDTAISNYYAFAQANSIGTGKPAPLAGFDIIQSQLVPSAASAGTHGYQTITPSAGDSTTFSLTNGGQTTTAAFALTYGTATAQQVAAALQSLSSLSGTPVSVSGPAGGPWIANFGKASVGSTTGTRLDGTTGTITVTDAGGTPAATTFNLALHPDAMIMANRQFRPIDTDMGVKEAQMTDPESGLSIRVLWQYSMDYRGPRLGFDMLYGFTPLRPSFGAYILA